MTENAQNTQLIKENKRLQNNLEWYQRFVDELELQMKAERKVALAATALFESEWGQLDKDRPGDEEPLWQALHDALMEV